MTDRIDVLDNGYVRLQKVAGDDLDVVNAAKVSFNKESMSFDEKAQSVMDQLAEGGHTSPLRHSFMTWEVKAPMFVRNQWWRYVTGHFHDPLFAWNEASRRYMTRTPEFYIPDVWRSTPDERRQGSGGPVSPLTQETMDELWLRAIDEGIRLYKYALERGVCAEQARAFLPANFQYTVWRWSCSLQGCMHFLSQRLEHDAQWEIQQGAQAVHKLIVPHFPVTFDLFDLSHL